MALERKIRLSYLIFCIMIFTIGFLAFTYQQMPHYFKKDLRSYDECTSAVVSNNLHLDIFPPRLRINSLYPEYQNWKEGPDYQHIPPAYLYVPLPFYLLDGKPSIEVRRLSYVLVAYLTGLMFIIGIALLFKQKRATFVASIVAWLWLLTPFVRTLLNANSFGYSDIVLACSITVSFLFILGLNKRIRSPLPVEKSYFLFILLVCTLPLLIKNVLGALPIVYLAFVINNGIKLNKIRKTEAILSFVFILAICTFYYGLSWWKSPQAFKAEFFVSFMHFGDYEGWKKPWHYFISHYLPVRYFGFMWWPFVVAFLASIYIWMKKENSYKKLLLTYFLSYFLLNLLVISIVTSKSANFILQGYIFILFFVIYTLFDFVTERFSDLNFSKLIESAYHIKESVFIVVFTAMGLLVAANIYQMYELRVNPYKYETQNEQFFRFGELARDILYANATTLFILDTDERIHQDSMIHEDPDYWFRYYLLFNTGSEARRIEEVKQFANEFDVQKNISRQYSKIYLVTSEVLASTKYSKDYDRFLKYGNFKILPIKKELVMSLLDY